MPRKKKIEMSFKEIYLPEPKTKSFSFLSADNRYEFSTMVEYDYQRSECICDDDINDYCRCTSIIDTGITKLYLNKINEFYLNQVKFLDNQYLNYGIERIIASSEITKSDFEVNVTGGYYGEEVSGVKFSKHLDICNKIISLDNLSKPEIIKKVLEFEYGYLLDLLKDSTSVEMKEVDITNIVKSHNYVKIKDCSEFYGKDYKGIRCVLFFNGKEYIIIDGNHRINEARKLGLEKISSIIMR